MIETETVIGIISLLVVFVGGLWGIAKYMLGRINEIDRLNGARVAKLHERVDRLHENTVRKDDLMQHIERIERALESNKRELTKALGDLSTKIDAFILSQAKA